MAAFEDLKGKLREIFQLDRTDLDFGLYRIMNLKSEEVSKFIEEDLLPQVKNGLKEYSNFDHAEIQGELEKTIEQSKELGLSDEQIENLPKIKDLKRKLVSVISTDKLENEIYSDLYNFFKRYYSEGDFMSLRRYKEGVYALPYEGEEVKLHWANADQYYIKSSETLSNYTFKIRGKKIRFEVVDATTEQNNNKDDKNRRFRLYKGTEEEPKNPVSVRNGEFVVAFTYLATEGNVPPQKNVNEEIFAELWANPLLVDIAESLKTTTSDKSRLPILQKHINNFTAKNTFDYFIHKDLRGFLNRELDFFIKNEIMHLDDIENEPAAKVEQYLGKIKVLRTVAHKIIDFLASIENFQKKLWLKKKFVLETNYCITLDRVPEELYPEIVANNAQHDEWIKLFAIDEIKGEELGSVAYSNPLTIEFLKANPFLVLDTQFFSTEFKYKLLSSIDNLDEKSNGLLIHSENFQALRFIFNCYRNKIDFIYIDPPYNTGSDGFLYKDEFKHSTWITMMQNRLNMSFPLQTDKSAIYSSINENELFNLKILLDCIYGDVNYLTSFCVKVRHENRILKGDKDFHEVYESLLAYRKSELHHPSKRKVDNSSNDDYEWEIEITGKPRTSVFLSGRRVDIFSNESYAIRKVHSNNKALKRINIRGSLREGNSSGRFYVSNIEPLLNSHKNNLFKVYNMGNDNLGYRYFWIPPDESNRKNGDYFQGMPVDKKDVMFVPYSNLLDFESDFNHCSNEGGVTFRNGKKPVKFIRHMFNMSAVSTSKNCIVLDYFGGSGSTAHAVIDENRFDGGNRKYIICEIGTYFDTVTKPRIEKVIYSEDWKDGKPKLRKGSSHMFKYIRLESYEDCLDNLKFERSKTQEDWLENNKTAKEEYMLKYMMDLETKDSLLSIKKFDDPFGYKINITRDGEVKESNVDLVETFNYLIGLYVDHIQTFKDILVVEGVTREGEKTLVIWRNTSKTDSDALDSWFKKCKYSTLDAEFDVIYVNGDNNLENLRRDDQTWKVRLIEAEFNKRMFDVQDVK